MRKGVVLCLLALAAPICLAAGRASAEMSSGFLQEIADGFRWRFNILGFGVFRESTGDVDADPEEMPQLSRYQAELDVRPDLALAFRRIELSVKPRASFKWLRYEDDQVDQERTETDEDYYVNEWLTRLRLTDNFFASYGREVLLWGPSYLTSPSNPFSQDNGRNNPKIELPGMDYARAVWVPGYSWSLSAIANTDEGRRTAANLLDIQDRTLPVEENFKRAYALKLDYTGNEKYASLIPSFREPGQWRLGFFGGWSASEALLLYVEGNVLLADSGPDEVVPDQARVSGYYDPHQFEHPGDTDILAGLSYTFSTGLTAAVEYYYNAGGCNGSIQDCLPTSLIESPYNILIGTDYLLVQLVDTDIWGSLDVILRHIRNLHDGSSRSVAILEYAIGNHLSIFAIGDYFDGKQGSELGSLLDYRIFAGLELTF